MSKYGVSNINDRFSDSNYETRLSGSVTRYISASIRFLSLSPPPLVRTLQRHCSAFSARRRNVLTWRRSTMPSAFNEWSFANDQPILNTCWKHGQSHSVACTTCRHEHSAQTASIQICGTHNLLCIDAECWNGFGSSHW